MCMLMATMVRTTVLVREDLLQLLKRRAGSRQMSHLLNEILEAALRGEQRSMFGTMKRTSLADLRDHEDRA